jgi:hypothetical protein
LLASCRDGCTEAIMLAHGFSIHVMVGLVNAGLATATTECVVAGSRAIEVARVRITDAGRKALRDKPMMAVKPSPEHRELVEVTLEDLRHLALMSVLRGHGFAQVPARSSRIPG